MYCIRVNFRSTWICPSAAAAKKKTHVASNDEARMTNDEGIRNDEFRLRMSILVRIFVISASSFSIRASSFAGMIGNGLIVPRYSSKEGKVAKVATVPPGRLAAHRRNKAE